MIILGFISIVMHMCEVIFFIKQLNLLFKISWYLHWISTYTLFLLMFYYFLIYLNIVKPNNIKKLFFDKKLYH